MESTAVWKLRPGGGDRRWFKRRCTREKRPVTRDIIIIIIIIIIISSMQGIYTYIPDTNHVPSEYSVAALLLLLFIVLISLVSVLNLLYFYISTFRSMCAVPNITVCWSSLTSCFHYYYYYYYIHKRPYESSTMSLRSLRSFPILSSRVKKKTRINIFHIISALLFSSL